MPFNSSDTQHELDRSRHWRKKTSLALRNYRAATETTNDFLAGKWRRWNKHENEISTLGTEKRQNQLTTLPSQNCNLLLSVIEIPSSPCPNHLAVYGGHSLENFVGTSLKVGTSVSRSILVGDEGSLQRETKKRTVWVWHVSAGQLIRNKGEALDPSAERP